MSFFCGYLSAVLIITDELKHIIGYETSFKGAMLIFNMFQHPSLNRRLLLVLLESLLIALFPNRKMPELFQKLHAASPRLNSMRKTSIEKENKEQPNTEDVQSTTEISIDVKEVKSEEVREKPPVKAPKESKNKLQCLSQKSYPSPKPGKKRKKSVESAIFYADYGDEDTVILPLGR